MTDVNQSQGVVDLEKCNALHRAERYKFCAAVLLSSLSTPTVNTTLWNVLVRLISYQTNKVWYDFYFGFFEALLLTQHTRNLVLQDINSPLHK